MKSKKNQALPLSIIKQNPGKQDSSFLGQDNQNQTASIPHSNSQEPEQIKQQNNGKERNYKKNKNQKDRKLTKQSLDSETPKIIIEHRHLKDAQIFDEQWNQVMKQVSQQMKQSGLTQQQIANNVDYMNKHMKKGLKKVLNSIEVKHKIEQKKVPIEVNLNKNIYKINEVKMNMFEKANQRVKMEKKIPKTINFNPQITQQVMIKTNQKKIISQSECLEIITKKNFQEQYQIIRQVQRYTIQQQRKFEETIQIYNKINQSLSLEINSKQSKSKSKPKIKINRSIQ